MTCVLNFRFRGINVLVKFETAIILFDFLKQNNVHCLYQFRPSSVPWIIVVIFIFLLIFIIGIVHIENSPEIITFLILFFNNRTSYSLQTMNPGVKNQLFSFKSKNFIWAF